MADDGMGVAMVDEWVRETGLNCVGVRAGGTRRCSTSCGGRLRKAGVGSKRKSGRKGRMREGGYPKGPVSFGRKRCCMWCGVAGRPYRGGDPEAARTLK